MTDLELMFIAGIVIFVFGIVSGYSPTITIRKRY